MKTIALITLLGLALPAMADRLPMPSDAPASFKDECGSCHLAYPPALLAAGDWQRLLGSLDRHFGSDATLDAKSQREIAAFLTRHAGDAGKAGRAGEAPRITRTARFVRKHDEVPSRLWRDPRVKSAANCEACHRGAADGRFSEHDIALPELRR